MENEPPKPGKEKLSLDARFASRPHVYSRMHEIADMMDKAIAQGASADEAEELAIEQLQQLGRALMTDWAKDKQVESLQQAQQENPKAIWHKKKE